MQGMVEFLVWHGYPLLFAWVLVEQSGLPLPSAPLLAAGALAGNHRLNLAIVIALPIAATAIMDALRYRIGRLQGAKALQWVCRVSIEPDYCVRRTQVRFERNGPWELVGAKFIPGLNAVAPPLAGVIRMPWRRFALFDGFSAVLWSIAYIGTGYVFSGELDRLAENVAFLGRGIFALMLAGIVLYFLWKYFKRQRFLTELRVGRITPGELHQRIEAGENVVVVDLRHRLEFEAEPETIPGALRMDASDLENAIDAIPHDKEIVLYCSCPNEATAAQSALRLRNLGVARIRPLAGGISAWRECGFPLEALQLRANLSDGVSTVRAD